MQKLALELDDWVLPTFETTLHATRDAGTVAGYQEDTGDTCVTQIYTCAGCNTYVDPCNEGGSGPDGGRRIIVYS